MYFLLVATVLGAVSYYFTDSFYQSLVAEDGIFENVTALILLFIGLLFLLRYFRFRKEKTGWWGVVNILIFLAAVFGMGEEISWGQRMFSFEPGEFFIQNNIQHEMNLHNLEVGGVNINRLIFSKGFVIVFGFYFLLSQLLYRKWKGFKNFIDRSGLQVPRVQHSITMLFFTGLVVLIPDLRIWELWEAMFVIVLLWVFVEPFNENEKLLATKTGKNTN